MTALRLVLGPGSAPALARAAYVMTVRLQLLVHWPCNGDFDCFVSWLGSVLSSMQAKLQTFSTVASVPLCQVR